jgi:flagellar biosynthesis/type III secretory pathway protein FliH
MTKGMAEGEAKGMAEGEAKGLRESVRTVLEARFQTVDAELIAAITAADTATLRDALRYVALDSVDEIRDRLRRRPE